MKIITDSSTITNVETNLSPSAYVEHTTEDEYTISNLLHIVTPVQTTENYSVYYSTFKVHSGVRTPSVCIPYSSEKEQTILDLIGQLSFEEHNYFGHNIITTNNAGLGYLSQSHVL